MDGDVQIIIKEVENALVVPTDAVYQDQDKSYVFTIDSKNKLIKTTVKTGIETDEEIEILEGLSENDQIVIKK